MANVYEIITERILARIEEAEKNGTPFFWVAPWTGGCKFAESYNSQIPYHGVNQVLLENGQYISYKALMDYKKGLPEEQAEKVKIKKGCHKYPVFYFGVQDKKDKDGNLVQIQNKDGSVETAKAYFVKYYNVFNIEDIEGVESRYPAQHFEHTPDGNTERLDMYIQAYARAEGLMIDVVKDGGRCFYRPSEHFVRVPAKEGFRNLYGFYGSVLHELIHSTSKGLHRELGTGFGTEMYSKEELVAELGSQMALNQFGIIPEKDADFNNDVAYIQGWASHLKDNKREILFASGKAQQAVEYFIEVAERQLQLEQENALTERSDDSEER